MVIRTLSLLNSLRTEFQFPNKSVLQWFPGHMGKGIKQMQQKLKSVDCIIEVHDARIPYSGRSKQLKIVIGDLKPHILVLNKKDLADLQNKDLIVNNLHKEGVKTVVFTTGKDPDCPGVKKLVPIAKDLISKSDRFQRIENEDSCIMIIGVPNVGKSSIINSLRSKYLRRTKGAPVGGIAGITRSVTSKIKVCQVPLIYVLDTPGILEPYIRDLDSGFKLASCSAMQDHLVGPDNIADYMLFWLNKNGNYKYVDVLGLQKPSDNVLELLVLLAVKMNRTIKRKSAEGHYLIQPDTQFAANYFIKAFRTGEFGKVMLDENNK